MKVIGPIATNAQKQRAAENQGSGLPIRFQSFA